MRFDFTAKKLAPETELSDHPAALVVPFVIPWKFPETIGQSGLAITKTGHKNKIDATAKYRMHQLPLFIIE
jgi:hypothetical protein